MAFLLTRAKVVIELYFFSVENMSVLCANAPQDSPDRNIENTS